MNTPNFTSLLTALRAFVLKSRPAYRDYLGTESVEEKTVLLTGTLSATGESVTAADGFTGFTNGQTYKATIGDETVEVTAQYGTGSFSECIVIGSSNVAPSDTVPGWMVCVYNGNLLGFGTGDWAGKQIEVSTSKMVPVEKWDVKKLPEECLPEKMPEKWAEELDTGGGVLYVPMELDSDSGTGTVNGVTFEEAQQAYKDGKMLVVRFSLGPSGVVVPMLGATSNAILFQLVSKSELGAINIRWTADGTVRCEMTDPRDYEIIPVTVTQTDGEYTATSYYTYEKVRALVDEGKNVVVQVWHSASSNAATSSLLALSNIGANDLIFSVAGIEGVFEILGWDEGGIMYFNTTILARESLSNDLPSPPGTAVPGTSVRVARADHVHPKELPDGATANQQLVTDSDGNTQWEDRPGGYDAIMITHTDTRTLTFTATETKGSYKADVLAQWSGANGDGSFPLNTVYDVTFNGVKYRGVQAVQIEERSGGYLGDPELSAYPFYIGDSEFVGSGIYLDYARANVGGDVEITVETYGTQIVKLPRSYVETPSAIKTDLSDGYWRSPIFDEKDNSYLLLRRVDNETWLKANVGHLYIDSQQPIVSNGVPMRFQTYDNSSMVSDSYGLELGNGYLILASSTADSTKKFKITVDDSGTLTATEVTTTT